MLLGVRICNDAGSRIFFHGLGVGHQIRGSVKFHQFSIRQHHDPVVVHHGADPVSDGQNCEMLEFLKRAKKRQFGKLQTFWPMMATGALWPVNLMRQRCSSNAISMGTPWWHCLCQRRTRGERKLRQWK